jgi:hypothetical protein
LVAFLTGDLVTAAKQEDLSLWGDDGFVEQGNIEVDV